jgi:dsDNA-binding SOS-regulon protein
MEGRRNKSIDVAKILFKSMEQSLESMKKGDFEMNSAALAEKAKTLARFLEEKNC